MMESLLEVVGSIIYFSEGLVTASASIFETES